MINEKYTAKEITIFKGVLKLLNEGLNLHTIKASDIADAANIGKGTLYNYFKSKEDIIAKAIIYNISTQFNYFIDLLEKADSFKEKFYIGLQLIEESSKTKDTTFQLLLSSSGRDELENFLKDGFQIFEDRKLFIKEKILEIADLGYKEEVIKKIHTDNYVLSVFLSCFMGFSQNFCQYSNLSSTKIEEAKANSYKLLIKGLN